MGQNRPIVPDLALRDPGRSLNTPLASFETDADRAMSTFEVRQKGYRKIVPAKDYSITSIKTVDY